METVCHQWCLFSAHAEVFPPTGCRAPPSTALLRACGGISKPPVSQGYHHALLRACGGISAFLHIMRFFLLSSPRMRRYFQNLHDRSVQFVLFSVHAEVFPSLSDSYLQAVSLLRACGGISTHRLPSPTIDGSSPRMRRYFRVLARSRRPRRLFSAHAEVFLILRRFGRLCSLFSAHAEILPVSTVRRNICVGFILQIQWRYFWLFPTDTG